MSDHPEEAMEEEREGENIFGSLLRNLWTVDGARVAFDGGEGSEIPV